MHSHAAPLTVRCEDTPGASRREHRRISGVTSENEPYYLDKVGEHQYPHMVPVPTRYALVQTTYEKARNAPSTVLDRDILYPT